jgi:hypothetical protein
MRHICFGSDAPGAGTDSAPWIIAAIAAMAIVGGMAYGMMSQPAVTGSYQLSGQVSHSIRLPPTPPAPEQPTTDSSTAEGL